MSPIREKLERFTGEKNGIMGPVGFLIFLIPLTILLVAIGIMIPVVW